MNAPFVILVVVYTAMISVGMSHKTPLILNIVAPPTAFGALCSHSHVITSRFFDPVTDIIAEADPSDKEITRNIHTITACLQFIGSVVIKV